MTCGNGEKLKCKVCKGFNRKSHRVPVEQFYQDRRRLKSGKIRVYPHTLCKSCHNAYNRERRRMLNRLKGKATRPQDVPWKRYWHELMSPDTRLPRAPFDSWLEGSRHTASSLAAKTGLDEKVFRKTDSPYISMSTVDTVFHAVGLEHMVAVLYPLEQTKKAA